MDIQCSKCIKTAQATKITAKKRFDIRIRCANDSSCRHVVAGESSSLQGETSEAVNALS